MPQISEPLVTSDAELLANSERDDALDSHTFTSNRRNERVRIQNGWDSENRRPEARDGAEPAVRSSMKPSHAANDNLIDRTLAVWKPRLGRDLSREDAREIAENVTGFFTVLAEWSRAERSRRCQRQQSAGRFREQRGAP
jgi:hypothetical protein